MGRYSKTMIIGALGLLAILAMAVIAAYGGYRVGSSRLDSGAPAVKFAKVGLREQVGKSYTGARVSPLWLPDGERFVFNTGEKDQPDFVLVNPETGEQQPFFKSKTLLPALRGLFGEDDINPAQLSALEVINDTEIEFVLKNRRIRYDLAANAASFSSSLDEEGNDPLVERTVRKSFPAVWPDEKEILSPNKKQVLSAGGYNLILRSNIGEIKPLTSSGEKFAPWSLNYSHWSPDSRYVAAFQMDERESGHLPVVDWMNVSAPAAYQRYPTVKGPLPVFNGAIVDVVTGARIEFSYGAESYVRPLMWRKDSSEFIAARLSRDVKSVEIIAISAQTGAIRTILSEQTDTYHMFPPNFVFRQGPDFFPLDDGEHFIWISEKSGFRQLYLFNMNGEEIRQLTDHEYPVGTFGGYDKTTQRILYTAHSNPDRPYDIHVHMVPLNGGRAEILSGQDGQHEIRVSPSGAYYIDKYSTTEMPPVVELRASNGRMIETLSVGKRPVAAKILAPAPEHFSALSADGKTKIYGVIYKPSGFDPSKKYPVVDGMYGGAFINNVPYSYDARVPFFGRGLAELGYVVIVVDARGTPGRGKAFKDMIYNHFGEIEIPDHVAAIKSAAKSRPWMDINRVGIIGHSFGGYFSVRALLQAPDFYKVAVASGISEIDQDSVSIATEVYMGVYEKHKERYAAAANAPLAGALEGNLLLVVATSDVNTPPHNAYKMINGLIDNGKAYDLLLLPGGNHAFNGTSRRYFLERVVAYFDAHL